MKNIAGIRCGQAVKRNRNLPEKWTIFFWMRCRVLRLKFTDFS